MECAQFESIVHDLERPGTEGFALRDAALAHAESCSHCARLMTDAESLDAALRSLAGREAERQASPRVEIALMEEFRRQKNVSSGHKVRWGIVALSAAAALLLAIGISLHRRPADNPSSAPTTNVAAKIPAVPAISPVASPTNPQQGQAPESQADDSEYATNFVRLPYADDPSALEDGAIVRVEMPRSALASFGLPVAAMESYGTVRADLIVSADGTPQAIRLVSQDNASQTF